MSWSLWAAITVSFHRANVSYVCSGSIRDRHGCRYGYALLSYWGKVVGWCSSFIQAPTFFSFKPIFQEGGVSRCCLAKWCNFTWSVETKAFFFLTPPWTPLWKLWSSKLLPFTTEGSKWRDYVQVKTHPRCCHDLNLHLTTVETLHQCWCTLFWPVSCLWVPQIA